MNAIVVYYNIHPNSKDVSLKRVKRWGFSLRELLIDPVGREQFSKFLDKEFSGENLKYAFVLEFCQQQKYLSIFSNKQVLGIGPEHESAAAIKGEGSGPCNLSGVSGPRCGLPGERRFEIDGVGSGSGEQFCATESVVFWCGRRPRVSPDEEWLIFAVPSVRHVQRVPQWVQEEGQIHPESFRRETLDKLGMIT